jgi:hypothetical protein
MMYLIHVEGELVSMMDNVNLHQINLDSYHAEGKVPVESRIKND